MKYGIENNEHKGNPYKLSEQFPCRFAKMVEGGIQDFIHVSPNTFKNILSVHFHEKLKAYMKPVRLSQKLNVAATFFLLIFNSLGMSWNDQLQKPCFWSFGLGCIFASRFLQILNAIDRYSILKCRFMALELFKM